MPTLGSLFSGIGGLDLGFERAGFEVRWQVENNAFCINILEKHWPTVKRYGDIREIKQGDLEYVDVITGGFPCQPVSVAGKKKGKEDKRWLWPEFNRIIRMVRPQYIVVENVPNLLNIGFSDVLRDLAESGYDAEWNIISAQSIGAPHLRRRIFIISWNPNNIGCKRNEGKKQEISEQNTNPSGIRQEMAYSSSIRTRQPELQLCGKTITGQHRKIQSGQDKENSEDTSTYTFSSGSTISFSEGKGLERGEPEGYPCAKRLFTQPDKKPESISWWATEPNVGRVAHGVPSRVDRLRALGNAVVPQVAEYVAQCLVRKIG